MLLMLGATILWLSPAIHAKTAVISAKGGVNKKTKGTYQAEEDNIDWFAMWVPSYPSDPEVSDDFKTFMNTASICYIDLSDAAYYFTNGTFNGDDSNVCSGEVKESTVEIHEKRTPFPDGDFVTVYTPCSSLCCDALCCKPNYLFWLCIFAVMLICASSLIYFSFKRNFCDVRSRVPLIRLQTADRTNRTSATAQRC